MNKKKEPKEKIGSVEQIAKSLSEDLVRLLEIEASVNVSSQNEDGEETVKVSIDTSEEAGLLIGAHGVTLGALQSFLAISLRQKTGDWHRVVLDIGDWREKHEEYLENLAKQAAQRARATGEAQHLYNLTPSQRRIIHMALSEEKGIETESVGEGEGRYLIVHAK